MEPTNNDTPSEANALAEELAQLVRVIELGGKSILSRSNDELLQSIVTTAARIFGAAAAAILLVDESGGTLVFRVETGNKDKSLIGTHIPLDKGIAGYVVMTGQAIAVSNVQQDQRFNAEFARSTGYVPESILAAPLLLGDQIIGVLEVLDKIQANSFGLQDMDLMGLFAHQAALAIRQSQQLEKIGEALQRGLHRLASEEGLPDSSAILAAVEGANRATPEMDDLLALAGLFNDLGQLGTAERRAGLKILAALAEVGRSRTKSRARF
jgi:GAF domain-containing protein